jgi:hypothetical protein
MERRPPQIVSVPLERADEAWLALNKAHLLPLTEHHSREQGRAFFLYRARPALLLGVLADLPDVTVQQYHTGRAVV